MGARSESLAPSLEVQDRVDDLLNRLSFDALAATRAVRHPDAGEKQSKVVGDLGDRADCGARTLGECALLDGDRGGEPLDGLDVGFGELLEKLPSVRGQRLDVAPLAFRVDGVERERRFARATWPRDDHQPIARKLATDILQVVLACAANDEQVHAWGESPQPAPLACCLVTVARAFHPARFARSRRAAPPRPETPKRAAPCACGCGGLRQPAHGRLATGTAPSRCPSDRVEWPSASRENRRSSGSTPVTTRPGRHRTQTRFVRHKGRACVLARRLRSSGSGSLPARLLGGLRIGGACCQNQPIEASVQAGPQVYCPTFATTLFPSCSSSTTFPPVQVAPKPADGRRGTGVASCVVRAYSSIGQSPRLITGPFLVRTQVGPLDVFGGSSWCEAAERYEGGARASEPALRCRLPVRVRVVSRHSRRFQG